MRIELTEIEWDISDTECGTIPKLPTSTVIDIDPVDYLEDIDEFITETLSDEYGFLVLSYRYIRIFPINQIAGD